MIQGQRLEEALKNILPVQDPPPSSGRTPFSAANTPPVVGSYGGSPTNSTSPPTLSSSDASCEPTGTYINGRRDSSDGGGHRVTHTPVSGVPTSPELTPLPPSPTEAERATPHQVSPVAMCSVATQVSSPASQERDDKEVSPVAATPASKNFPQDQTGLKSSGGEVRVQDSDSSFIATPDEPRTPMEEREETSAADISSALPVSSATPTEAQLPIPESQALPPSPPHPQLATTTPPPVDSPSVSIATTNPGPAHEVTATTDFDLNSGVMDTDKHTPSPETGHVETMMKETRGQAGPSAGQEEACPEVGVEQCEDMEVGEEGEEATAEGSPATFQLPSHRDTEEVVTASEGQDHSPHCHGDEIQHDLNDCDITRSPERSDQLRPPSTLSSSLQPNDTTTATSDISSHSSAIATSSASLPSGLTTTAGPTPNPSVVLPGLSLPPSFSVCVPSMNWRAQSFAKVFGLNALPIKLLPSKGGHSPQQLGGGSGAQTNGGQKEGRTKRVCV